jgi:glycosyltransferase involved in cell wall biosynthesis
MVQTVNTPEITVLMPVFNGEKYLKDAIESILRQTFTNFEFLIINDGSSDNTVSIIESYADARIHLIHNEKNLGLIASLNKGVELASGTYIARMDCDDISFPERLAKQLEVFKTNPDIDILATQMLLINSEGFKTGMWSGDTGIKSSEAIKRKLIKECCIAHPSVMVRSSLIRQYFYDAKQKGAEDWDLWLRMASDGKNFFKINELLLKYRVHSLSATIVRNQNGLYINRWKVLSNYCIQKIKKGHINFFDFKVLCSAFSSYSNHLVSLISPNLPVALREVCTTNIFVAIRQLYNLAYLKISPKTALVLFIPYCKRNNDDSKYVECINSLNDKNMLIFITDKNDSLKPDNSMVNIAAISSYPFLQKWVKKKIRSHINKASIQAMAGINSMFYYSLTEVKDKNIRYIDVFDEDMNLEDWDKGLIYNYGIWSMPYAERYSRRIVVGKEAFEEMKELYNAYQMAPDLINRLEYISNFMDLNKQLAEL